MPCLTSRRGEQVPRSCEPNSEHREDMSAPRGGQPVREERLHLAGVTLAQTPWPETQKDAVDDPGSLGHHASSVLRRARDRATLTSVASRSVSAARTRRPARVMR